MSRVLGVDLGARRIGLAVSDPARRVATPLGVLERPDDADALAAAILAQARRVGADRIVVGVPRSLDGRLGPAARAVLADLDVLRRLAPPGVHVEGADERFTTVIAARARRAAPARRERGRRTGGRRPVDDAAAAVLLQSWLDAHPLEPGSRPDEGTGGAR